MSNKIRHIFLFLIDAALINLSVYVMLLLRFDGLIPGQFKTAFIHLIPLFTIITLLFLAGLKLYNRIWEYASIGEMMSIIRATTSSMAIIVMTIYLFKLPTLPRTVYIGSWVFMTVFIGASRVWWRVFRNYFFREQVRELKKVLIVGAGDAGALLVKELQNNPFLKRKAIGMVDDDKHKQHMMLSGVPILGTRRNIEHLVADMDVDEVIITMPSVPGSHIREIVDICKRTSARLRILPGIYESTNGNLIKNLRDVQMEDLLRREQVKTNLDEISGYISGKTILVTGAGGSIGSELCRQIARFSPQALILLDCCENNLFDIEMELRESNDKLLIFPELIDIRNSERLEKSFNKYPPSVVFHAAAYKHVPMLECHPDEAISNNILGTRNVARLADRYGVETFISISTDKAVNPTSVMGASKRIAEMIILDINNDSKTKFAAVRFGNVLGSRGSVVPTFTKQIEKGGPLTVTHPDMTRYFMTIPEAVQLVIQAGAMATGGEIFVLDMGEPVKIVDLATDLIKLYGYKPEEDIHIKFTGIRPGEKLYEELFTAQEQIAATRHERIHVSVRNQDNSCDNIGSIIDKLFVQNAFLNRNDAVELINQILKEYNQDQEKVAAELS